MTRMKTVLPAKAMPSRKPKIGRFARLSKNRRLKIGLKLKEARLERDQTILSIASVTEMSEFQVIKNEKGEFGRLQDGVILAHIVAVGLSPREVGV